MINSYIMGNAFVKINLLLDQYCHRCQEVHEDIGCSECHLEHRKNNNPIPYAFKHETDFKRLEVK